ncbi:alpha/beta hydrolase family protein [Aminobacter carboxidus]|uniref:Dienelactone hydrolase family protein n=1 Tax=Aminobacter carboxidus TaxID=376165 RepID=A0ABR9GSM5_9HYPH|nr:alpha/beta fold hydrolase [Aminobacter carboxidus]MBE1206573.1 dienelactone hydrolase family protein [Aminobacter carboxidus]
MLQLLTTIPALIGFVSACFASEAGVKEVSVAQPGRDLNVTVWYPAVAGGKPTAIGDNRIFKGASAVTEAPPVPGRFPLILLSHGSGGRVQAMSWLATELAKAGFVVAGPNHPGTTSGDSTPADTPKLWQRTADLSAVIDAMTGDSAWSNIIDADKIGVVGFSLGGAAAMEISGARANLEAYASYCDSYRKWDCAWYAGGTGYVNDEPVKVDKVDLRSIDRARFEQSNLDRRIKTAVLADPGLAQAYDDQSLKEIAIPMHFINLGTAETIPLAVIADRLAKLTPKGSYTSVAGATHFSFLPECKEGGAEFLKSVGEIDPICTDEGTRPRGELHAEMIGLVKDALVRDLKAPGQ